MVSSGLTGRSWRVSASRATITKNGVFLTMRQIVYALLVTVSGNEVAYAAFVPDTEYLAQPGLAAIRAIDAYEREITGSGVLVAVVDSGINPAHQEFTGAISGGYNFALGGELLTDVSSVYHGSHVAGVVAARRDGSGMMGVAPDSGLVIGATNYSISQLSSAINFAVGSNVTVINNSWGDAGSTVLSYNRSTVEATYPDLVNSFRNAVDNNTVIVFANGNDGYSQPQLFGGMPYHFPEFRRNWITVVASTDDGVYLTPYSNRCGVAASWCVAAPGGFSGYDIGVYSVDGTTTSSYKSMYGTSNATPFVSGAIALLADQFPYMSAEQLVSVLLTTSKFGTSATLSPLYGRGLINIGKAINGPSAFEFDFDVDTQGHDSVWSNNISGSGGLLKRGDGTLSLSGTNTFSGGVDILGGVLLVSDDKNLGDVSVGVKIDGGTLRIGDSVESGRSFFIGESGASLDTQGFTLTLSGELTGRGLLRKGGDGMLALTGSSRFDGTTEIVAGSVVANTGSLSGNVVNQATIVFDQEADGSFEGNIDGSGQLVKRGQGALMLSGSTVLSGGTRIEAGSLIVSGGLFDSDVDNDSTIIFDQTVDGVYNGAISGSGGLIKKGTGHLMLSGSNSYSGGTVIEQGWLNGDTGSLQGDISGDGNVAFLQTKDGVFGGVIAVAGTLKKDGAAALTLTGNSMAAAAVDISSGVLVLDGDISSSIVRVGAGAALAGNGRVSGDVVVMRDGMLDFFQYGGVPDMQGNLLMSEGSVMQVSIGDDPVDASLDVSGMTVIDGGIVDVMVGDAFPVLQRHVILRSDSGISGMFEGVSFALDGFQGRIDYTQTEASIVVARSLPFFPQELAGYNRKQVVNGLSEAVGSGFYSDAFAAGVNSLYQSSTVAVMESIDSLTGEIFANTHSALHGYFEEFVPLPFRLAFAERPLGGRVEGYLDSPRVWARMDHHQHEVKGSEGAHGYAVSQRRQTIAIAGGDSDDLSVGVLVSQGHQTVERDDAPDQSTSDLVMAGAYVLYKHGRVDGYAAVQAGVVETETRRQILIGDEREQASSDGEQQVVTVSLSARINHDIGRSRVSPLISLNYTRLGSDAVSERSNSSFALHVDAYTGEALMSAAGIEWAYHLENVFLGAEVNAALLWQHDFTSASEYAVQANFAAMPGAFEVRSAGGERDKAQVQGGVACRVARSLEVSLNTQVDIVSDARSELVSLGVQYQW